ncbi:MAG TPA: helix-turn-helix domain-containing protein [Thermomicrobiales bacterium]|jgi:excisionase family DNA binding protein
MSATSDLDLLTMREVAALLKVSEVTVARWLKQGRLPAYRVGPRAVRVRRVDVDNLIEPREVASQDEHPDAEDDWKARALRPLTKEEQERGLQAMRQAFALSDEVIARRGGKPFSVSSTEIIRREREKRTRQIEEAIWGKRDPRKRNEAPDASATRE